VILILVKRKISHIIEEASGIHFPQGVVWKNACREGWQEPEIMCKFYASKNDIQKMFSEKNPEWSNTVRYFKNNNSLSSWFKPDSIKNFQSTRIDKNEWEYYIEILYEDKQTKNNTNLLLVYMIIYRNL
jgi:hypothetical protein